MKEEEFNVCNLIVHPLSDSGFIEIESISYFGDTPFHYLYKEDAIKLANHLLKTFGVDKI